MELVLDVVVTALLLIVFVIAVGSLLLVAVNLVARIVRARRTGDETGP